MAKATKLRREEISKMIISEGVVKVKELVAKFNVSSETIRKDLTYLEKQQILVKNHGGASIIKDYYQLPVDIKLQENLSAKKLIARKAIDFIEEGNLIYLDPGSTSIQIAKFLRLKKNITVLTNSITIANIIADSDNEVIMIGGVIQKRGKASVGYYSFDIIDSIHIDVAFLGSDGFKGFEGPTTFSLEEAQVRKHIIKQSDMKILVCDASKFDKQSTYMFGKFSEYNCCITNQNDSSKLKQLKGIKKVISVKGE